MRVLVVEDRARMARLLERALRREGHSVVLALDGEQALSCGRAPDLDVILLDVAIPLIDGFTVIRSLRAERLTTPTIMVTEREDIPLSYLRGNATRVRVKVIGDMGF